VWHAHLAGSALRLLSQRGEVASFSTTQQRQEHDLAGEHHFRGDGPLSGARWLDHQRSLRSLSRACATPRTTTPLRRPLPRSRRSYAGLALGLARPCWRRLGKHYPQSVSRMPRDSSSTPVTILRINYCETC